MHNPPDAINIPEAKSLGRVTVGTFKAIRIDKADKGTTVALTQFDEAELMEGDVTVAVEYSTLNYKDGLAVTGKAPVVRRFPMIAGIDLAGTVESQVRPVAAPNTIAEKVVIGNEMNATIDIARAK